jgi:hypothetical protein
MYHAPVFASIVARTEFSTLPADSWKTIAHKINKPIQPFDPMATNLENPW